ncbi:MAG TPA: hypothetical protein VFV01_04195 [Spirillospora sp.]|nr:hypothetical protein [Spirillospora sp.]
MTGLLTLAGLLLMAIIAPALLDRGAREHRFYRGQDWPWTQMLTRMEGAGVRFNDVSAIGYAAKLQSMIIYVVPATGVCLVIGAQSLFGFPSVVAVGLAALVLAAYGTRDDATLRNRGYVTRPVTAPATRWLLVLGFLLRLMLVLLAVLSAEKGVHAVNRGDWPIGLGLMTVAVILISIAHFPSVRAERLALRDVLDDDASGILLLRSFEDDSMRVRSPWTILGRSRPVVPLLFPRFEEFLTTALLGEDGRLVALGRPGERLPALGAVRTYYPMDGWEEAVLQTAARAKAIVVIAGLGDSLSWEMQQLRELGLITKVLLVIPPDNEERSLIRLQRATEALTGAAIRPAEYRYDTLTAITCDRLGRVRYCLAQGRDWHAYLVTVTLFFAILDGKISLPEDRHITGD